MSFSLSRLAAVAAAGVIGVGLLTTEVCAQSTGLFAADTAVQAANRAAADAAAAIKNCDYDKWAAEKQSYDRDLKEAIQAAEQFGHRGVYDNVLQALATFPAYPFPCHEVATPAPPPASGGGARRFGPHYVLASGAQLFVGVNIGGGFQNTNFSVDPPFNTNGSGVIGGGFGGVLLPIPNTNAQFGFRFGGEGGNVTGNIAMPAASPRFDYMVKTDAMLFQEAIFKIALGEPPRPQDRVYLPYNYYDTHGAFLTGSVGVAESHSSVNGTAGAFSVTDSGWRPGVTFTAGLGVPVAALPNGVGVDLFAQYRGTQWVGTVSIPGGVNIGSFTNEVDVGLTFRLWGPTPPPAP